MRPLIISDPLEHGSIVEEGLHWHGNCFEISPNPNLLDSGIIEKFWGRKRKKKKWNWPFSRNAFGFATKKLLRPRSIISRGEREKGVFGFCPPAQKWKWRKQEKSCGNDDINLCSPDQPGLAAGTSKPKGSKAPQKGLRPRNIEVRLVKLWTSAPRTQR